MNNVTPEKIRRTGTIDHNHKNPHDGFGNKVNYDYACKDVTLNWRRRYHYQQLCAEKKIHDFQSPSNNLNINLAVVEHLIVRLDVSKWRVGIISSDNYLFKITSSIIDEY